MKKRYLLVARHNPFNLMSGAAQRTAHLLNALKESGEVDLVVLNEDRTIDIFTESGELQESISQGPTTVHIGAKAVLRRNKVFQLFGPFRAWDVIPPLRSTIKKLVQSRDYAALIFRYFPTFAQSGAPVDMPVFIDADDLSSEAFYNQVVCEEPNQILRIFRLHQYKKLIHLQKELASKARVVWFANAEHVRMFPNGALLPNIPIPVNPVVVEERLRGERAGSQTAIFVGALNYEPNRTGVLRFAKEVWPLVLRDFPNAALKVIGSGATPEFLAKLKALPGIEPIGFVANLEDEYLKSEFAIIPVQSGSGTSIKLLEAIAYGLPCVTTAFGARGLDIRENDEHILVGKDIGDLAKHCCRLFGDPILCRDLSYKAVNSSRIINNFDRFEGTIRQHISSL